MHDRLKRVRTRMGLTQAELAKELQVTLANYRHFERGELPLSLKHVMGLLLAAGRHGIPNLAPDEICDDEMLADFPLDFEQVMSSVDFEFKHIETARIALRAAIGLVDREIGVGASAANLPLAAATLAAITASYQRETVAIASSEFGDVIESLQLLVAEVLETIERATEDGGSLRRDH